MISEAIESVRQLAEHAMRPHMISLGGDKAGVYHMFNPKDNMLTRMETEVCGRLYKAATMAELAAMVNRWGPEAGKDGQAAAVFISGDSGGGVIAVLNEGGRRDEMVQLNLKKSEPFRMLATFAEKPAMLTQRELLWLLRTTFGDCLTRPGDLLQQVKVVKFGAASDGTSEIRSGRESIDKRVVAEMKGATDFPETVEFEVPVFTDLVDDEGRDYLPTVQCAMDARADEGKFVLRPVPGQLEEAEREACAWIKNVLRRLIGNPDVGVFVGAPR